MAFDVSALDAYIAENQFDLMTATVLGAKMMSLATVVPNIKGASKLPQLAQSVIFQDDDCTFDASGSTELTQRTLTPGKVKINDSWCPKNLEPKYLSAEMAAGAHHESVTPEYVWTAIMGEYTKQVARDIDIAIWKGEDGVASGNNAFWDGFTTILATGTTDATGSVTDVTDYATADDMMFNIYDAAALAGLTDFEDFTVFVGYDAYAAIVQSLIRGGSTYGAMLNNGMNGDASPDSAVEGLNYLGTGMNVVPVVGLNGANKVFAGRRSNFFIGIDGEDLENIESWYSQDDRVVKMAMEFKVGCQVAFPLEVISVQP